LFRPISARVEVLGALARFEMHDAHTRLEVHGAHTRAEVLELNWHSGQVRWPRWLLACLAAASLMNACEARGAHRVTAAPNSARSMKTSAEAARPTAVIPIPAKVALTGDVFAFRADTWISIPPDPRVARIARYFADLLREAPGIQLTARQNASSAGLPASVIEFRLDPSAPDDNPESYAIDVSQQRIVASARDPRGLFYAAVTLWELCTSAADAHAGAAPASTGVSHIALQGAHISDTPRLAWRGLMLDSARHFQSPEFIMRYLDWMALHKLNVLHWHLTDDQAWRLQIKKYPRLSEVGAWRVPAGRAAAADIDPATGRPRLYGGFYSQDDVRRIVAHAAERNITIVPEIDMPGHATAAIVAYPRLGVTDHPPTAVPADWGIYSNLYNVEESTFTFLEDVLDEVMALFPGEYVHVGGDEAVKDQWKSSPRVQERMRELHIPDEQALQSYFIQRIGKYLSAHGRRLIGWDEILEGGIARNASIMSWRGLDGALAAVRAGHDAVLSPWPTLYFDNRQGAGSNEPPGRGRVITLQDVYAFDPMPASIELPERHHILGLQANVWTEYMRTQERVAYMSFPRAAAVAEIGWSPVASHDWNSFLQRLPAEFARYRALGLPYSDDALQPSETRKVPGPFERHASQDLRTCTDKLVLSLEDDAPIRGPRAVFLIDIMNPCWIFPSADLSRAPTLLAAVGQVPFNFQIGHDKESIRLAPPQTPDGELEVHLDSCEGERIGVLPLAPAVGNDGVTQLPPVSLPRTSGHHDLCFRFTQRTLDPLWALDWVQLRE
jgi:hexosaminidase